MAQRAETDPTRVVVFIDAQNLYNDARRAFIAPGSSGSAGQVDPMRFAHLLCSRHPHGCEDQRRVLQEVRIYRGKPDPRKEPQTAGAHMRQCSAWRKLGATVLTRPLRYPADWPRGGDKPEEKGIDVALAVDMVTMAINGELDVAILASTDTDLGPALEAYFRIPFEPPPIVEVASWRPTSKQLRVEGRHVWCHWLEEEDYNRVRDRVDYNLSRRR